MKATLERRQGAGWSAPHNHPHIRRGRFALAFLAMLAAVNLIAWLLS